VAVRRLFVLNDVWIAQGALLGAHVGDFEGKKATNKPVGVEHVHIGSVEGGRVKRLVSVSNGAAFMRQIGVSKGDPVPIPQAATETEVVKGPGDPKNVSAYESMADASAKNDIAGWTSAFAPDAVLEDRAMGKTLTGVDAIKKEVEPQAKVLSDVKRDMRSFGAGAYVVSYGTITATNTGPIGAAKPTKKTVTFHAVEVAKFKDGKVAALERYWNPVEFYDQLGIPEPAGKPKKPAASAKK
jgi:ketosteroid isomerase-like protein